MVQIDAYKLLMVSEKTILTMVEDVPDDAWFTPLPGMDVSFDWILGHYAAVDIPIPLNGPYPPHFIVYGQWLVENSTSGRPGAVTTALSWYH